MFLLGVLWGFGSTGKVTLSSVYLLSLSISVCFSLGNRCPLLLSAHHVHIGDTILTHQGMVEQEKSRTIKQDTVKST